MKSTIGPSLPRKSRFDYARDLAGAGFDGAITEGRKSRLSEAPRNQTRGLLLPTLLGAAIGGVASYRVSERKSSARAIIGGIAGGIAGLSAGLAWESRHIASEAARGAMRNISQVRDSHWLEKNPIAYG